MYFAGESLITYINEVHGSIIAGLEEAITSLCTNLTIYFNGYTKYVDSDVHAVLDEYEITDIIKSYDSLFGEFDTLHEELSRTLSNVSDIVSVKKPNIESLENYNESVKKYLRSFVINWYGYESRHNALDFRDFDSIISEIIKLVSID